MHSHRFFRFEWGYIGKANADPLARDDTSMGSETNYGGIAQSGVCGSYTYAARAGFANEPVTNISFHGALRLANWLENGQGGGDIETGAHTLLSGTAEPSNGATVSRNPGAIMFVVSENEPHKAVYCSPGGAYFEYPSGTGSVATCSTPKATANSANCAPAGYVSHPRSTEHDSESRE